MSSTKAGMQAVLPTFKPLADGVTPDFPSVNGATGALTKGITPAVKAVTEVMTLLYAVGYWGSWFNTLLYMPFDNNKWPLSYVLYEYVNIGAKMPGMDSGGSGADIQHQAAAPFAISMAVVVLTLIPILVVYPFLQKHFTKGMLTGAIKG